MQACAYVVGKAEASGLYETAIGLEFVAVRVFEGTAAVGRQLAHFPLCFFLFAEREDPTSLAGPFTEIRSAGDPRLRFAPLVYFAHAPSRQIIKACINMGFDDVISLPLSERQIHARLARQVGVSITYFETASYFGPDRRGRLADEPNYLDARIGGPQHRRIEIVRTPERGPEILGGAIEVLV